MIELYKILSGKYGREAAPFAKLWKDMTSRTGVRGNSLTIFPQRARTEIRKHSFALRIVITWKCLPDSVITAHTTNTFQNRLDKYWANQDIVYDDHKITITGIGYEIEVELIQRNHRLYDTSIYTVFVAVFFFNFDHMFCFCPHIFCNFPKAAYVSSLTSFNQKVALSLATKPLNCAHINSIGFKFTVSNGGSYYFMSV